MSKKFCESSRNIVESSIELVTVLTLTQICPRAARVRYHSVPASSGSTTSADSDQATGSPQLAGSEPGCWDLTERTYRLQPRLAWNDLHLTISNQSTKIFGVKIFVLFS